MAFIPVINNKYRILHECSCFIEFIKRVGERDKMRGLSSILSLFRTEFDKFNNTKARMLDSIYHMTLNHFCRKNVIIFIMYATL